MEFDKHKRLQRSVEDLLLDQLTHNADVCDVTVKHGAWEKKFHWCVLVESPYFACIRRCRCQEKESGVITLVIGSPAALEEGLLFLYGIPPRISAENIEALFEVAEYLFLPELKAKCVRWIKQQPLTQDNCLSMLKLSNIYEFPWQSCEDFVSGSLHKLMKEDSFLDVTESAVLRILTDSLLSYVKTCDKFEFLVNWAKKRPNRVHQFEKLLNLINFDDVDQNFITNVVLEENLIYELDDVTAILKRLRSRRTLTACDVLLFPESFTDDKLPCFDITRRRWSSVVIKPARRRCWGDGDQMVRNIECVQGNALYSLTRTHLQFVAHEDRLHIWNLENKKVKDINIHFLESKPIEHSTRSEQWKPKFCIHNNKLIIVEKEEYEYTGQEGELRRIDELLTQIRNNRTVMDRTTRYRAYSSVYIGEIKGDSVVLSPMLLNLHGDISHICANGSNIAFLSNSTHHLYLYSLDSSMLERFSLSTKGHAVHKDDVLAAAGSGFVIYNNETITHIEQRPEPYQQRNFHINQYKLPPRKHDEAYTEYRVCDNMWYRYSCTKAGQSTFCCTTHTMFMTLVVDLAVNPSCAHAEIWDNLPAPTRLESKMLKVTLPKNRLACIMGCPHCNVYGGDSYEDGGDSDDSYDNYYDDYYYDSPY